MNAKATQDEGSFRILREGPRVSQNSTRVDRYGLTIIDGVSTTPFTSAALLRSPTMPRERNPMWATLQLVVEMASPDSKIVSFTLVTYGR